MSFSVIGRTREIALCMAVGADRARVIVSVLKEGIWLSCMGLGIGLVGAYFVSRDAKYIVRCRRNRPENVGCCDFPPEHGGFAGLPDSSAARRFD